MDEVLWTFKGLPQGNVLSPLLYAIYVKSLDSLDMTNCEILQYADDVAILSSSDSIQKGLDDLKSALEQIDRFFNCISLELSPSKTKLCVFSYGLKKTHNLGVAFKDHFNPNESTIKYFRYHTKKYFRYKTNLNIKLVLTHSAYMEHVSKSFKDNQMFKIYLMGCRSQSIA